MVFRRNVAALLSFAEWTLTGNLRPTVSRQDRPVSGLRAVHHSIACPCRARARPAGLLGSLGSGHRCLLRPRGRLRGVCDPRHQQCRGRILVGAYGLTTGSGIVEALVRAKERGVDVRVIADKTTPCERASGIEPLAAAGVPIWIDDQARIAHAKTMVIDSTVTLTGSYNWTRGAAANSEDLNLISSATVAAAYATHWRDRLAVSSPFNRREDWCRAGSVT
jgi:hypothetical protein